MIYTAYDMPRSLKVCDALAGSWDQTSCTGGVFMENLSSSYGVKSKWLRDNDLIYPCNIVAERHKIYCYLMVTSRILPTNGYNFAKTSKTCRTSEKAWVATCFQSLGRDASGNSRQNPDEILTLLQDGREHDERLRLRRRPRHVRATTRAARRPRCSARRRRQGMRSRCFEGIGTILGGLHQTSEARRAACAAITKQYAAVCSRGAGA